jgi:transcriptional regulator with XRE-family HTH domain
VRQWSHDDNTWEVIAVTNVGPTLRRRRLELGWTMRTLEEASGVDDAVISRIENGEIAQPRVDKISRIATALGLDPVVVIADAASLAEAPSLGAFVRSRYPDLPAAAVTDIERHLDQVLRDHHINPEHRKEVP